MIRGVTLPDAAFIAGTVPRIVRREASQPERRQKLALDNIHDSAGPVVREHRVSQADGENLVWPNGAVFLITIDDVEQAARLLVPELSVEALERTTSKLPVESLCRIIPESAREIFHRAESVVPQRLNLDGFATPRRDDPISDLGVHPRQLNSGFPGRQEAVTIDTNAVTGAAQMPVND